MQTNVAAPEQAPARLVSSVIRDGSIAAEVPHREAGVSGALDLDLPAFSNQTRPARGGSMKIVAWFGISLVLLRWLEPVFRPRRFHNQLPF